MGFEVRVERTLSATQLDDHGDEHPQGLRVGWSMPDTSLLLGEDVSHVEKLAGGTFIFHHLSPTR